MKRFFAVIFILILLSASIVGVLQANTTLPECEDICWIEGCENNFTPCRCTLYEGGPITGWCAYFCADWCY